MNIPKADFASYQLRKIIYGKDQDKLQQFETSHNRYQNIKSCVDNQVQYDQFDPPLCQFSHSTAQQPFAVLESFTKIRLFHRT